MSPHYVAGLGDDPNMSCDSSIEQLRISDDVLKLTSFNHNMGQPTVPHLFAWKIMADKQIRECNASYVSFRAQPEHRLNVIRAIERAGGTIEEFHTEAPGWESLVHTQFGGRGEPS